MRARAVAPPTDSAIDVHAAVAAPKTVAASPTVVAGRVVGTRARRGGADQLADGSAFSVAQEALGAAIGGLPRRLAQARRLPEASSFAVLQDAAECVTRRGIPARDAPLLLYCPLRPGHAASAASLSRRLASQRSKYAPSGGQYRAADEQVDDRNSHELHRGTHLQLILVCGPTARVRRASVVSQRYVKSQGS